MSVLLSLLYTNDKNEEIRMTEREILTEFIELYSNLPCLWDYKSEEYTNRDKKNQAWSSLNKVHKRLQPESTTKQTKKKVDHLRTSYQRELKKVKASKQAGTAADKVHKPLLWYFNLMSFLDKDTEQCKSCKASNVETFTSDEESQHMVRRKTSWNHNYEQKSQNTIEITPEAALQQENKSKKQNSFGLYVGEQLEEVTMFQRQVAEKLISDIIFLARTGKLKYDSKIEAPRKFSSHNNYQCSRSSSHHTTNTLSSPEYLQVSSPSHYDSSS